MTALCASWAQYTAIEFQSGGMDLKNGYSMMLQMVSFEHFHMFLSQHM